MTAASDNGSRDRARLMAFAFARADLLIEIDRGGAITYASGAARWAVGMSTDELVGRKFPTLASPESRGVLRELLVAFKDGKRLEPETMLFQQGKSSVAASIAGCPMPDMPDRYYLSIAHPPKTKPRPVAAAAPAPGTAAHAHAAAMSGRAEGTDLLDRKSFQNHAQQQVEAARARGEELEMTMVALDDLDAFRGRLAPGKAETFLRGVGLILKNQSAGGDSAAQIADNKFSVLHTRDVAPSDIQREISALAQRVDPSGTGTQVAAQSVSLDVGNLDGGDAGRALVYAINKFAQAQTGDFSITSLSGGLKELVAATVTRIETFRANLRDQKLSLAFQPVVDLRTGEIQHQEALTRLPDGSSPYEMITFAEEIGVIAELDHAVCQQVIDLLAKDPAIHDIAINVSGHSLQSEAFVATLLELLRGAGAVRNRVIVEVTESSRIDKLDKVGNVIRQLQMAKQKVCLDDFGSGAAAFTYLRAFPVDVVKIDGTFVKNIVANRRDLAMVGSIAAMCVDMKIDTIAEFVEDADQVNLLVQQQVKHGQGYLFGKPGANPHRRAGGAARAPAAAASPVPRPVLRRPGRKVEWS